MKKNSGKRINSITGLWDLLNQSIYVGERYEANMNALFFVSVATAILGLVLAMLTK